MGEDLPVAGLGVQYPNLGLPPFHRSEGHGLAVGRDLRIQRDARATEPLAQVSVRRFSPGRTEPGGRDADADSE